MTVPVPVVILGAGGTAADVLDFLAAPCGPHGEAYQCLALLDDDPATHGTTLAGVPVAGPLSAIDRWPEASVIDALGSPRSFRRRPEIIAALSLATDRFATVIHPAATVSPSATIGAGSIIYPETMIGPGVVLGEHVTVLSHTVVNHHSRVGDYGILASHVALGGRVEMGRCCYAGMGSRVIQDGRVGDEALLGMGSVVIHDVPAGSTVAGNPARPLPSSDDAGG